MKNKAYRIRVTDDVVALIRGMHPELKKKVKSAFEILSAEPDSGKALKNELEGLMSFRVSRFRIIYRVFKKRQIEVVAIGPGMSIYKETLRMIRRENESLG
ncbi:MAG: type II toxin-antitoxin system RelE/ParE family toxin [bacterium]